MKAVHQIKKRWLFAVTKAFFLVVCAPSVFSAEPIQAQSVSDNSNAAQHLAERLTTRLKGFPGIDKISKSAMPGLYEVQAGTQIFYADPEGDYLIRGELIQTDGQRNLTRDRIAQLTAIDLRQLPLADAVSWKNGNGQRRIVVFADPNCPYCQKLEKELASIPNLTVFTFLFPILAPTSVEKASSVWCSAAPSMSWTNWMR